MHDDDEAPDCDHEWHAEAVYEGARNGRDTVWWECSICGEQSETCPLEPLD